MRILYVLAVLFCLGTGFTSSLWAQCGVSLPLPDPTINVVPGNAILEDSLIRVCSSTPQATLQIFNASTTIPDNQSYQINWGDGSIENFDNTTFPNSSFISHSYAAYGYYDITVTVTGINGCVATKEYVFYNGSNPSVGLANPGNTVGLCAPATIDFPITNTGNNPTGTIYYVYIGGQLIETFNQANVPAVYTYTFLDSSCGLGTSTGNYQNAFDVQIVASNPCGSSQATIEPIEVSTPPDPYFDLSHPTLACQDDVITISDASTNVNEVYSGNPSICESSISPSWVISPGVSGIDWTLVSGNIFSSPQIQIVFSTPGNYTVTMTITSPSCGPATFSQSFEILESPVAGADYDLQSAASPGLPDECLPTAASFINQSSGDSLSYAWYVSPGLGWQFAAGSNTYSENLDLIFDVAGTYQVTLVTSNPCRAVSWDTIITIASTPLIDLLPLPDFCESATLDFNNSMVQILANGGTISHYQWEFPGASPPISNAPFPTGIHYNSPGEYIITLRADNQCGSQIVKDTFVIQEPGVVQLAPDQELCVGEPSFLLSASPGGGVWTGNGVSPNGWFTPSASTIGTNTLTYAFLDGGCDLLDSMEITVFPNPEALAGVSQSACERDEPLLISGGSPLGGSWTVNNGGVITATNAFDPVASGVGVYTLTYVYTDSHGCTDSDSKTIVVYGLPDVAAGPDQDFCLLPNEIQLTGFTPAGGTWTGQGVTPSGIFNPQNTAGSGVYPLYYTYTNPVTTCSASDSLDITIIEPQLAEAGPNDSLCIDEGILQLSGFSPANGIWSGPGIIDSLLGIFDPAISGGGSHLITYTYGTGSCLVKDQKVVYVIDLSDLTIGAPESYCITDEATRLVADGPDGGIWSGPGIIDMAHGIFDPAVAQAGTHTIRYTYSDPSLACTASASKEIKVYDIEPASFEIPEVACEFTSISFINHSNPAYDNFWDFGDGETSIEKEPIHLYGTPGNYSIRLVVANEFGCRDTMIQDMLLTQAPEPIFSLDKREGCAPFEVNFTNQSSGFDVAFEWDFGNGIYSDQIVPPPVTYEAGVNDTSYIVTLTVSNFCGSRAYNAVVVAHASPHAHFGATPQNLCSPMNVEFANISTGNATSYFWDFGNGHTSTDSMPGNQVFIADSLVMDYTITLIASNSCGTDTAYQNITVQPADVQAFFNISERVGCQPLTVEFYNFASPGAHIDWDFGDGNTSSLPEPIHTFTEPGNYRIIQYASNVCGYDTISLPITVLPSPEVRFSHAAYVCLGQEISFLNESVGVSGNSWDFGDGQTSQLTSPVHVYTQPGIYTVSLEGVSQFNQCPATYTSEVIVQALPVANFAPEQTYGCAPFTTTFLNQSDAGTFFIWEFGDGQTSVEENPSYTFTDPGTYEVSLIATDAFGCSKDTSIINILVNPNPLADFQFDQQLLCRLPVAIEFENLSQGADAYAWDLGDDSKSNDRHPVHSYHQAGTFNIKLIATNQFNCQDTIIKTITTHPEPIADFEIGTYRGCSPLEVSFSNYSVDARQYYWDFGNGELSEEENPVQLFDSAGQYDITLVVGIDDICYDTLVMESGVKVDPRAYADFEAVATNAADGTYELRNLSLNATIFNWDFGDGTLSEEVNPSHRYFNNGARQIYLESSNEFGCPDDTLLTIIPPLFTGLFIPSGFSPEQGIGKVRLFQPAGVGLQEYHIQVFSPYGQLLWESTALEEGQPSEAWDGRYNGKLLPQDVYVWKAYGIFENGKVWSGQENDKGVFKTIGSVILLR